MRQRLQLFVIGLHTLIIILWASAFAGIRVGLEGYTPEQLSLLRLLVGSAALVILAILLRMRLPEAKDCPAILLLGALGFAVYHTALNIGEMSVSAGPASLLVSTTPLFAAALALVFFRERFGWWGWAGGVIAFLGVALISIGTGEGLYLNSGALFILIASFAESIYFVFQRPLIQKYGFLAFTTYTIWSGTLIMLVFLPGLGQAIEEAPLAATISAVYLGLFPTLLPYLALAYLTSRLGAAEATSSLYLTPAAAFVIAWIWLGEVPTLLTVCGGVIALIGVLVSTIRPSKESEVDVQ